MFHAVMTMTAMAVKKRRLNEGSEEREREKANLQYGSTVGRARVENAQTPRNLGPHVCRRRLS